MEYEYIQDQDNEILKCHICFDYLDNPKYHLCGNMYER